tara:strand:+ start:174 stop:311 length:138 start_codon:yes stop_codon:yes gene_type:complete
MPGRSWEKNIGLPRFIKTNNEIIEIRNTSIGETKTIKKISNNLFI